MGPAPIVSVAVPVGMLHVDPAGLQRPRTTVPPDPLVAKGRFASATTGTVMIKLMFEALSTVDAIFVSVTITPPTTTPILVFWVGSVLGTNPVPVTTTLKVWPEFEVGRLAGVSAVRV